MLDTTIVIDFIKRQPVKALENYSSNPRSSGYSYVTLDELRYGAKNKIVKMHTRLRKF